MITTEEYFKALDTVYEYESSLNVPFSIQANPQEKVEWEFNLDTTKYVEAFSSWGVRWIWPTSPIQAQEEILGYSIDDTHCGFPLCKSVEDAKKLLRGMEQRGPVYRIEIMKNRNYMFVSKEGVLFKCWYNQIVSKKHWEEITELINLRLNHVKRDI